MTSRRLEIGRVTLDVPRDRDGSFTPQVVRQRRLVGFDKSVISLYVKGMTTGDTCSGLSQVYDTTVSKDLVSRVTDSRQAGPRRIRAWQSRPMDTVYPVYPVILIDVIVLKVREGTVANRPVSVAIGIDVDGYT